MRILIVGGTGKIGQAVANELSKSHDIIIAGHSQGDLKVDITDELSIENMYK